MSVDQVGALKHAKLFRPFEIVAKNGRNVFIERPTRIALSPTDESVSRFGSDGFFFLTLSEIVELRVANRKKRPA